ncbi:MAG: protein kinase domain-containing protein [Terriglobales bacterium]
MEAAKTPPTQLLEPGTTWGQFKIIAKLGSGSFGTVYHARDLFERDVALKLLDSPEAIREGRVLSQLKHPNIVSVFSYENTPSGCALSMEFISGQDLEQLVDSNGKFDVTHAALVGTSLCRALAMVHRKGLVHRDIKAANVIRQAGGRIVLVDFGLGQSEADPGRTADIAGTLPYMAPELFEGGSASFSSDLYGVGVLLFYLVSSQFPVSEDSFGTFQEAHRSRRRHHLIDLRPDLPPEFIKVVETAVHPEPARRFRTAGQMAVALESLLNIRRRRSALSWVALAALATILAGGIGWKLFKNEVMSEPELLRITAEDALSRDPSLTADAKLLAYSSDQGQHGNLDIWVKQVPQGASVRITNDPHDDWSPSFSPDGHWVVFRSERDGGGIYLVPAFGGPERLIAKNGSNPRFSPDGAFIAYWTGEPGHVRSPSGKLFVVPTAGSEPRQLAAELPDARIPIWAPDSQHILFQGSSDPDLPPDEDADWWLVNVDGSHLVRTTILKDLLAQGLEIHPDAACWHGDSLVFSAAKQANVNIWTAGLKLRNLKVGLAQRLTSGSAFETSPWVADTEEMAFAQENGNLRIWSSPLVLGAAKPRPMERLTDSADFDAFPSVSRDDRWMAFTRTSSETGHREIWTKALQSGEETSITKTEKSKYNPVISPDGKLVAFSSFEEKDHSVYLVDIQSHIIRKVCSKCGIVSSWLPDGRTVLTSKKDLIHAVDVSSGNFKRVLSGEGVLLDDPEISPDGKWLAFSAHRQGEERHVFVASVKNIGHWFEIFPQGTWSDKPHWAQDGKSIFLYSDSDGFPCIWKISFRANKPAEEHRWEAVQHFHNTRISPIHISQPVRSFAINGKRVVAAIAENSASVWMRTEPRK